MRVLAVEPGYALCRARDGTRRVRTALVGEVAAGEWLLVFLDSARERLSAERAHEIDATLRLVEAASVGLPADDTAVFVLPSALSRAQLRALTGAGSPADATDGEASRT